MAIRNAQQYKATFWDWGRYDACFGDTGIRISDVDGIVERNGHFLFIETKSPGQDVTRGQERLHDALIRTGKFVVIVIWGRVNEPEEIMIRQYPDRSSRRRADCAEVRRVIQTWFEYVDRMN